MFSTPKKECSIQQKFGNRRNNNDECDLIEMVNKLQDKLVSSGTFMDFSLPQIVVVGCQSAGKSSVLENIIGREFLPRGTGAITRRPTMIQVQPSEEVFAVFLHLQDKKFTDFEAVKQEIIDETLRDPGPTGFSPKPINLKIYAPNVLKLTLVDMPGIFRNEVGNLTVEDIRNVKNMSVKYIEQPNSLILAVSQATNDIATSDALEIAKQVDPKGERTLGVLTKLDLMDAGTHALEVLENRTLPLPRGYVGVLNRSQQDILERKSIEYSLAKEKEYFENHPFYSRISDVMGSPYLQKVLHSQLREHIKKTLPTVRKQLTFKLNSLRSELREFEAVMNLKNVNSNTTVQAYMLKLVQIFIEDIHIKIFGNSEYVSMSTLSTGAVINYKIYTDLQEILEMPTNLTDEELMTLITNLHGIRNTLSTPSISLEAACGLILREYIGPLAAFVDSISDLLISGIEDSAELLSSYPKLRGELVHSVHESIDRSTVETKELLEKHIKAEMNYCNIYHWDFNKSKVKDGLPCSPVKTWKIIEQDSVGESKGNSDSEDDDDHRSTSASYILDQLKENENAKENAKRLAEIVKEYIQMIQKQIGDVTLKYVMCFLVKGVSEFIKSSLLVRLMGSENLEAMMEECERDFRIREDMIAACTNLEEALNAIQSF